MRWTKARQAVAACTAAVAMTSACQSGASAEPHPLTAQLQAIRSQHNGLYFSPHLLQQRAGVQDISFALRTMELSGAPLQLELSPQTQLRIRSEAVDVAPLLGRDLLVPLYLAGAGDLLSAADAAEVRSLRTPAGWFVPAKGAQLSEEDKAVATEAALNVLDAVGQLSAADRAATEPWLRAAVAHPPTLRAAAAARRALRNLTGAPVTAALPFAAPDLSDLAGTPPQRRLTLLDDAFDYAEAVNAGTGELRLDRTGVEQLFRGNAQSADYGVLFKLSTLMFDVTRSDEAIAPAIERLEQARLPDGTFRDPSSYVGSAIVSVYVMRLQQQAGEPVADHKLAVALERYAQLDEVRARPAERLIALGAAARADAASPSAELRRLCGSAAVVPAHVTPADVTGWRELSTICREAGAPTQQPTFEAWPGSSTEQLVAQAELVLGLLDTGRAELIPHWISTAGLRGLLDQHADDLPFGTVADVARAYRRLPGATPEAVTAVRAKAAKLAGCAELPKLYRATVQDTACDLRTSVSVRLLG